jgi:GWxTD domain-containing protein
MTAEEAATWKHLTSDSEKDVFVEQFWSRRNPVQGSSVNSFKQEHYRRIAYANVHFASSIEGDLSDRGRAYIVYGNPSARRAESEKVHGQEFPSETWEYPGKVTLEFVDRCHCGEYKLYQPTSWPSSVSQ